MSAGPIKRERESTTVPPTPKAPHLGDVVIVTPAPLGFTHWRITAVPSSALGRNDVVTLACIDPKSPLQTIRRRVFQLAPSGVS